ncbi:Asp/Glu/hydantoin racemase [Parachaetomium inaequale]|uniref:Asp/Glu/hydantoin racemase n=1 Tax=Parachaetomium inaequale TaxID=2588326 RepID=A0AAN6PFW5_9PEZI|nr:Asp/Glu/hydantoin racemase [Parachaetomium inaequale]
MATNLVRRTTKILVLNPNSSKSMTHGLEQGIRTMELSQSTEVHTYTAPGQSPGSINNGNDIFKSSTVVHMNLEETGLLKQYDAVLVACFSEHPLVPMLAEKEGEFGGLAVTGIFESSILACLSFLRQGSKWGIVTTGKYWEDHLTRGVNNFLGTQRDHPNTKFAGVETTGLNAGDFHGGVDPEIVRRKLKEATGRLLEKGDVQCVVMGCAGMAGLEEIIRSVAVEKYGPAKAKELLVVDGVRAGIGLLEQMVRNKRAFQRTP